MGNNKNDILGVIANLLRNVDINQVISIVDGLRSQKSNNSGSSSNIAAALGNFDLGRLSEALANLTSGQPRQEGRPSFFNPNNFNQNNFTPNNFTPNINNNFQGLFDIGSLQSVFSGITERLEGLRNFKF